MKEYVKNSDKFLSIYNELDSHLRKSLNMEENVSHSFLIQKMAEKDRVVNKYYYDLKTFAKLRNAIVHNPDCRIANPIAEPHEYIVKRYEEIKNKVKNPPIALNTIAIKAQDIYNTTMKSNALYVMQEMNKNSYTHVPVVDKGALIGVFSENTVFSYLVKNQLFALDNDILIEEFAEFIPINSHGSEYFEFVSKNTLVMDIGEIFQKGLKDNKRISIVFINETGNIKEKILGLITPWDLAGFY